MATQFDYRTRLEPEEGQQLQAILAQCFNFPPNDDTYSHRIGAANFRAVRQAGQIAGGLAIIQMGQWFGGQSVPMAGIAAVGVAPEYRGSGTAIALLQYTLTELRDRNVAISALYPATQRLYRKAGYEQGGAHYAWEVPADLIQLQERLLPVQRVDPATYQGFARLYQHQAKQNHGNLDRTQVIWQNITQPNEKEIIYAYVFGDPDRPEGYLIFNQQVMDNVLVLQVRDWVALTPAAIRSVWAFLADHRSQVGKVRWRGAAIDSFTALLAEQVATVKSADRWMLRIIDVQRALEHRGYPTGIQAELHLQVEDEWLSNNHGKFILSVTDGKGKVTQGGKGEVQLGIRGLASLYTHLLAPQQLQAIGQLTATESALATANLLFSGAAAWMPDFF